MAKKRTKSWGGKKDIVCKDMPAVAITLTLPAQIKMLTKDGRAAGTLCLTEKDLEYKRANKKKGHRFIDWVILDKVCELGFK